MDKNGKRILMVTMQMGIGGAETHILELSRALVRMGYDVDVASKGGSFVKELEADGIRHFTLPLNSKKPQSVLRSYRGLDGLVRKNSYYAVHAHARIPAVICGRLARRYGFRFVTTAHWVFTLNALWARIADWGQKTLAVSEDIKQYLIDGYGVFADNITVTVNALDTEKFSPAIDAEPLYKEFNLPREGLKLVCVSRMDASRGAIPLMLARISPRLRQLYPGLRILLVGSSALGGEESVLPEIERLCAEDRKQSGEETVILCGARNDVNRFTALADVFVGASRAALEAMSAAKPVVLCGNEGYFGILGKDGFAKAAATNYCCRDCARPDEERLFSDVVRLCSLSADERRAAGEDNREYILAHHSLERMAMDAIKAYDSAYPITKRNPIVISGYYGFCNTGDDSLLTAIIGELRRAAPGEGITVLARRPRRAQSRFGVRCVDRFSVFSVIRELRHARLLISGGGNLLQNGTSNKSLIYYLSVIRLARMFGVSVMIYANGIGPLYGKNAKRRVLASIAGADAITLREPGSLALLSSLGADVGGTRVTADPALLLAPAPRERIDYLFASCKVPRDTRYILVSLREVLDRHEGAAAPSVQKDFEAAFASELSEICTEHGLTPLFVPMQETLDADICRRVLRVCNKGVFIPSLTVSELLCLIPLCSVVCGMRLHSLIYSLAAGVPFVALSYDDKVKAFAEYSGMADLVISAPAGWQYGKLSEAVRRILQKREELCGAAARRAEELRELAKKDAEYAARLAEVKKAERK